MWANVTRLLTEVTSLFTNLRVIQSFRDKALRELWEKRSSTKIDPRMQNRIVRRLDVLDRAVELGDLNVPGFDFHPLRGFSPIRYSLHVNGPCCITFEFSEGDAHRVDFEQYH